MAIYQHPMTAPHFGVYVRIPPEQPTFTNRSVKGLYGDVARFRQVVQERVHQITLSAGDSFPNDGSKWEYVG